jgi:hypothetical protein
VAVLVVELEVVLVEAAVSAVDWEVGLEVVLGEVAALEAVLVEVAVLEVVPVAALD